MDEEVKKCSAILELADDYGDNISTMHCQLPEGHEGQHFEKGTKGGGFEILWSEDDREECIICKKKIEPDKHHGCTICHEVICSECVIIEKDDLMIHSFCNTHDKEERLIAIREFRTMMEESVEELLKTQGLKKTGDKK